MKSVAGKVRGGRRLRRLDPKRHGSALLIALTFLVLLSAVVLALFATARTDRQNAAAFSSGQETLMLGDATVNLVQGQIRDATIQPRVAWASQPGMVRTFDTSGKATAYKLYSSDAMVVSGFDKSAMVAESTAMASWNAGAADASYNALWSDLNAPAIVKRPDPADETRTIAVPVFPIAAPAAIGAVEGFSAKDPVTGNALTSSATRLPMPVKWIYVLRDGQMVAPSGGGAKTATFAGPIVPTSANPIVGRIAFWTDDDTCKLNINTASEGTFWDTPRANTFSEQRLGLSLPVQGEFNRLAGHPAGTSLSPVFGTLIPPPGAPLFLQNNFTASLSGARNATYQRALDYFKLTPRVNGTASDGSSQLGLKQTARAATVNAGVWPAGDLTPNGSASVVTPDTDRLYATSDELLFSPDRTLNNPALNASEISKRDFFITAQSRAPETTLFGTPRISLWPLNTTDAAGKKDRTIKDRLIAFCSTLGGKNYFFDREVGDGYASGNPGSAVSATADADRPRNNQLIGYLQKLVASTVPGFGSSFTSKWGGASGANKVLAQAFDTIRTPNVDYVDSAPGPGPASGDRTVYRFGARATNPRGVAWGNPPGGGAMTPIDYSGRARGFVTPAKISGANGAGRSLTFSQFVIVIMPCKIRNTYGNVTLSNNTTWTGTEESNGITVTYNPALPSGATLSASAKPNSQETLEVRAFLLAQPFNPTPGGANVAPSLQMEVSGNLNINGVNLGTGTSRFGAMPAEQNYAMQTGSLNNPQYLFYICGADVGSGSDDRQNILTKLPAPAAGDAGMPAVKGTLNAIDQYYPYVTPAIPVVGGTITFGGGTLTVTLKDRGGTDTLQTFSVDFPAAGTLPAPQLVSSTANQFAPVRKILTGPWDNAGGSFHDPASATNEPNLQYGNYLSLWKRMRLKGDENRFQEGIVRAGDIALAVQANPEAPVGGDLRLLALEQNIPSSWFVPAPGYPSSATPSAYSANAGGTITPSAANLAGRLTALLRNDGSNLTQYGLTSQFFGKLVGSAVNPLTTSDIMAGTTFAQGLTFGAQAFPVASSAMTSGALRGGAGSALGDWGSGFGNYKDGAVFPRPEAGLQNANIGGFFADRQQLGYLVSSGSTFEPNRMVPSAGILSGILTPNSSGALQPWQTLLFNPRPAGGSSHPGFADPPDHAFLDNFWMPVVEPYAISEPLSTAGKVNLNTQLAPFTHITRDTALRGVLKPVVLSALEDAWANTGNTYKHGSWQQSISGIVRNSLNLDEATGSGTMAAHAKKFDAGDIYRVATEVSTIDLVPDGQTLDGLGSWWNNRRLTSDTLREQPYTALLSRVTTKSNTYTVHYRVQALRQVSRAGQNWTEWNEGRDQVTGELRGSTTIERFLDPNATIPDYTQVNLSGTYEPIDKFYRWRVLSQKQFAP